MFNPFKKIKELEEKIQVLEKQINHNKIGDYCDKCEHYYTPYGSGNGARSNCFCKLNEIPCKDFVEKQM